MLYLIVVALIVDLRVIGPGCGKGANMALAQWPALAGTGLPVDAIALGIGSLLAIW